MKLKTIHFLCHLLLSSQLITAGLVYNDSKAKNMQRAGPSTQASESSKYRYDKYYRTRRVQGPFVFRQKVNHDSRRKIPATFRQRYWVNDEFYVHNGPVFLIVGGMVDASQSDQLELLREKSMLYRMAEENRGMLVLLEHRYFGGSFPVDDFSEKNLEYLTIHQVLGDIHQFAWNGMDNEALWANKRVPWVLVGGGYAGGLVHWAKNKYPKLFWAGYSSSGLVRAKRDFWQFWHRISRIIPEPCANAISTIAKEFDRTLLINDDALREFRRRLGISHVKYADDIAYVLSDDMVDFLSVGNEFAVGYAKTQVFAKFCKAISYETLPQIVYGWHDWNKVRRSMIPDKDLSSHDKDKLEYTDTRLFAVSSRTLHWLHCNELGWLRTAPKRSQKETQGFTVVSEQLTFARELRICENFFPERYRDAKARPDTGAINDNYGGWERPADRVYYMNGGKDPYIDVTLMAPELGNVHGGQFGYAKEGYHMGDLRTGIGKSMDRFQRHGEAMITIWLKEWYST